LGAWFPAALAAILIAERLLSIRGLGEFFFVASFQRDLLVLQALLSGATCVGAALFLFSPQAPREQECLESARPISPAIVWIGVGVLGVLSLIAIIGPALSSHDARALDVNSRFQAPSWDHWLGTNRLGSDLLTRALVALRTSIWIAGLAVVPTLIAGAAAGLMMTRSRVITTAIKVAPPLWLGVPVLWWLLALYPVLDFSATKVLLLVGCGVAFSTALMVVRKQRAVPAFMGDVNVRRDLVVIPLLRTLAAVILVFATIQFLGLGFIEYGQPEFGMDIEDGISYVFEWPHLFWVPSAFLFALLFSLNVIANALSGSAQIQEVGEV
jgi:peptide/nickel transport system permease protein